MRGFFVALAAVAAMVGCESVDHVTDIQSNDKFTLRASIVDDATRVKVEGEKFNEVSWVEGDVIRLESAEGVNMELRATTSGRSNVEFVGDGSKVADVDTYYAVYPSTNVSGGSVTFYYADQSGDDVAALVAKAKGVVAEDLQLQFRPVNALLHVAVSGVESLAQAELLSFTGKSLAANFTYNFEDDTTSHDGSATAYTVASPSAEGFFFRLPADLDMTEGYIIRLTDNEGNVCAKAYNGKIFERGTTTRVDIEWSLPVVTLGEPMTSYSYYLASDSATANGCANDVIYFPTASTYSNMQNAMVVEAGYFVDGVTYVATLDTATRSFSIGDVTDMSLGAKRVEAYVKTTDGRMIKSAPAVVHITGLPYHADWRSNDYGDWKYVKITDRGNYLRVDDAGWFSGVLGCIISPEFHIPSDIATRPSIASTTGATSAGNYDKNYIYAGTRNSQPEESGAYVTVQYVAADALDTSVALRALDGTVTLTSSNPCCVFTAKDFSPFCSTNIYQAKIEYAGM